MLRWLLLLAFLAAVALVACSDGDDGAGSEGDGATVISTLPILPTGQPSPARTTSTVAGGSPASQATSPASRWSVATEFDYGFGAPGGSWQQACGKVPIAVDPKDPCVMEVMRLERASPSAIEFFQRMQYFLVSFEEKGRVDYGQGGAPWFNMGRPTPIVFLNGSPDIIEASIPQDYKTNQTYARVLTPVARQTGLNFPPTPWLEYGELTGATTESGGGQRFVIEYPLRDCRACEDVGYLPIAYMFDAQGRLTRTETLPFKAP